MSGITPPPEPTPAPQPTPAPGPPSGDPTAAGQPGVEPTQPLPSDTVTFGASDGTAPPAPPAGSEPAFAGDQPPGGAGRRGVVAALVAVMALILGGGAFAFVKADPLHLFHSGPQAAQAIPSSAIAYFGLDLDPSAEQKIQAIRFLEHFPSFKQSTGIDDENVDVRKVFIDKALESSDCGLTYADDFEPWLGTKLGVAVLPPENEGEGPVPIMALQVSDADAAKQTIQAAQKCEDHNLSHAFNDAVSGSASTASLTTDTGSNIGLASTGDYLVVAESQEQADRYANAAEASSLADDAQFKADMDSLGDVGVATGWADVNGLLALGESAGAMAGSVTAPDLSVLTSQAMRVAATLRFSSDHAEIVSSTVAPTPPLDHPDNAITGLPDTTVFAMSLAGGGDQFRSQWDDIKKALSSTGGDVDEQIQQLENQTGLSIPDDIETLLGDNLLVAVDHDGLDAGALQHGFAGLNPQSLNFGVRFSGDKGDLDNLYQRVLGIIQAQTGVGNLPYSKVDFDQGFAVATNDDYGQTLADLGGNLGDSADFTSAVDDAADASLVVYFDWNLIEQDVLDAARSGGADANTVADLEALRAFGMWTTSAGDYSMTTMRLSVDD